jgi:hypothetical protein
MSARSWFVDDHRADHNLTLLCELVELNRATFYRWVNPVLSARSANCGLDLGGAQAPNFFRHCPNLFFQNSGQADKYSLVRPLAKTLVLVNRLDVFNESEADKISTEGATA